MERAPLVLDGLGKFQRKEEALGDCVKCRFSTHEGRDMVCRRMPPSATIIMVPAQAPRVGLQPQVVAACPVVRPGMWCGEFVERGAA
jgi:hypothetical protein